MDFHGGFRVLKLLLILKLASKVNASFEFCAGTTKYTVGANDCPQGVIFKSPQKISNCFKPTLADDMNGREHKSSICDLSKNYEESEMQIQFVDPGMDDTPYPPACECGGEVIPITTANTLPKDASAGAGGDGPAESVEVPDILPTESKPELQNQTMRLFMYLTGNLIDENDGGPAFLDPLVAILNSSFAVVQSAVDNNFVPREFLDDIKKAFLFLLRESDTTKIKYLPGEDRAKIEQALASCASGAAPIPKLYFGGKVCKTTSKVKSFAKSKGGGNGGNYTGIYDPTEFSMKWMNLDFIEEAVWSVADIVHGLCYGSFQARVNGHHLYQRAIERFFTKELLYRWKTPIALKQPVYWDNVFSANVKITMRNLDSAVQAAYLASPFLHRLKRPFVLQNEAPDTIPAAARRKRQAGTPVAAFCVTDSSDKQDILDNLSKSCQ